MRSTKAIVNTVRNRTRMLPLIVTWILLLTNAFAIRPPTNRRHLAFVLPSTVLNGRNSAVMNMRGGGDEVILEAQDDDEEEISLRDSNSSADNSGLDDINGGSEIGNIELEEISDSGEESLVESDDGVEEEEEEEEYSAEEDSPAVTTEAMPATVETTVLQHVDTSDIVKETSEDIEDGYRLEEDAESGAPEPSEDLLTTEEIEAAKTIATGIRGEGKELHDDGKFTEAASRFSSAANLLLPILGPSDLEESVADDFATCRLHEALCLLKAEDYEEAIRACTDVLDGPTIPRSASFHVAPALRARAFHRRAKAQMELGNEAAALQDARDAAFLGDQKAVALYGKLMRENSGTSWTGDIGGGPAGGGFGDLASSSALFESLLSKSSSTPTSEAGSSPMDAMGGMGGMSSLLSMMGTGAPSAGGLPGKGGEGVGSLAKSVLSSVSKRLEDEKTQDQICNFLQGTSGPQLQQMASLAGLQVDESLANRLAGFCQGVTPKLLRRTLRLTKAGFYSFNLVRKVMQFISKYRSILILLLLVGWTKSALLRPLPVNKRAAQLAAKAATAAAIEAEKITAKVTDVVSAM